MEKKKFNFNKFGLVLCVCFMALFAFIPFSNLNNIDSVSASSVTMGTRTENVFISNIDKEFTSVTIKNWNGIDDSLVGSNIWTDGINIYFNSATSGGYVLDVSTSTWSTKTWNGSKISLGSSIWTDGVNIYYSSNSTHYVLDKETSTWSTKVWNGLTSFSASYIWTDGDNVYFDNNSKHYILDKETSTWSTHTWNGLTSFNGDSIWTDSDNIYYDYNAKHYILDKETSTWIEKSWNGLGSFNGKNIWTDGKHYYCNTSSYIGYSYVLDKETSRWSIKNWNDLHFGFDGSSVWTDGVNYYSSGSNWSVQFTTKSEYELGLSDGYTQGKEEGLEEGYFIGRSAGMDVGYNEGYTFGYEDGLENGYKQGHAEGETNGLTEGYTNGYNQGKSDGLTEGFANGYDKGKTDGYSDAVNNYSGMGPFTYSRISYYVADSSGIDINNPITELYSGYFSSYDCVEAYNCGFLIYDSDVEDLMIDNDDLQIGYRIVFDSPISCANYSHLVPLYFSFGNILTFSFTDGSNISFNMANDYYDYIDLSDYSSKYIKSIDVIMLGVDYLNVGLAFSNDYVQIYDLGFSDGKIFGFDEGYSQGIKLGYNNGYNVGMSDSNQYTFYNLFGAVLDAPVRVFSDLFNFELLGVNLLGLLTGLFTLAVVIVILKKVIGGK